VCTVHIYYGAESGAQLDERTDEIARIAGYLAKRADRDLAKGRLMILLGDFNIVHPEHQTMRALTDNGFIVPKSLQNTTNLGRDKYYDQIAFKTDSELIAYVDQPATDKKKSYAGIVEIFETLYTRIFSRHTRRRQRRLPTAKTRPARP
jgi:exonuclease III